MFCALNGTTSTPASASSRHSPAVTRLLPTSEAVPRMASAPIMAARRSPADRVSHAARVRAGGQHAARGVDGDGADAAGPPGPVGPAHHGVALAGEGVADAGGEAALDAQLVGMVVVGLEG